MSILADPNQGGHIFVATWRHWLFHGMTTPLRKHTVRYYNSWLIIYPLVKYLNIYRSSRIDTENIWLNIRKAMIKTQLD